MAVTVAEARKREILERIKELKRYQWRCQFRDCDGMPHVGMPHKHARANQRISDGAEHLTALITGRGYGKTRSAAEFCKERMLDDPKHRVIVVAPSFGLGRDICIEGESGLLNCLPANRVKKWNRSHGQLTLTNGSKVFLFGAHSKEDAERLRGPQSHTLWFEELAQWRHQQLAFDNAMMGNRLGHDPRAVITTTPKPTALIRKLFAREAKGDPQLRIVHGSTFENASNLPLPFLHMLTDTYRDTRLGAQELEGQLLEDVVGALWTRDLLRRAEVSHEGMVRIVVAVDPPGSHRAGAEAGIVVVGRDSSGLCYVFEDASFLATPEQWSSRVTELVHQYGADAIVAERNYGGDMVESNIRATAGQYKVELVSATRGKQVRAEPVVNLYERRRVLHVGPEGSLAGLEQQMCSWVPPNQTEMDEHGIETPIPESDYSPDRMDALVWAVTDLALKPRKARTVMRMS